MEIFSKVSRLMGNRFVISVSAKNQNHGNAFIEKAELEIIRIEKLLTTFSDESITNKINLNAGIKPLSVPKEVFELIARAQKISELTDGAFDLSYGSIDKRFWNFDKTMTALPDEAEAKKAVYLINYKNVILDKSKSTVYLTKKGMRIGFGGIGKGYAADQAKNILQEMGVQAGVVNASGDLNTWGEHPTEGPWTISLAHPDSPLKAFSKLTLNNMAVATSGNYEKYVLINGQRYSHTINPKTGFPVQGIKSVSVICPFAELADALATPITILGVHAGISLINQMKGVACVIIDDNNKMYHSDNINLIL
jgi:FAD:protein FMN transferase